MEMLKMFAALLAGSLLSLTAHAINWQEKPGAALDIGVGANGAIFVIGTDVGPGGGRIYKWDGNGWGRLAEGNAVRIAVDPQGNPWVVNNAGGSIYKGDAGGKWTRMPGSALDIGIGADGSVFVVGTDKVPGGGSVYRWNGNGWGKIGGGAIRIAVDQQGMPWVVNTAGNIYRGDGKGAWQKLTGLAIDIGIGANGEAWVVGTDKGIYRWTGTTWEKANGTAKEISVDNKGNPWIVTPDGHIFAAAPSNTPAAAPAPTSAPANSANNQATPPPSNTPAVASAPTAPDCSTVPNEVKWRCLATASATVECAAKKTKLEVDNCISAAQSFIRSLSPDLQNCMRYSPSERWQCQAQNDGITACLPKATSAQVYNTCVFVQTSIEQFKAMPRKSDVNCDNVARQHGGDPNLLTACKNYVKKYEDCFASSKTYREHFVCTGGRPFQ